MLTAFFRIRQGATAAVAAIVALAGAAGQAAADDESSLGFRISSDAIEFVDGDKRPVLKYVTNLPRQSQLSVQSASFIHPLFTPAGHEITALAPEDHRHHRGVFLAFVEVHGRQDADFWGWGEHAPKEDRVIEHLGFSTIRGGNPALAVLSGRWQAKGETMIRQRLSLSARRDKKCNVVDLEYVLSPVADTRLARWAFSGFCVRLRKDGAIAYTSPEGPVSRPAVNHLKPELNWPAADWYDATIKLADQSEVGVAVVDHPDNPKCTWHNESRIHLLNPCIVAPGELMLAKDKLLVLRYRLVAHDGAPPVEAIKELAAQFRRSGERPAR
jgi:hypothetical protein